MADKDLLVVISEMLNKQDQNSEILNKQSEILNKQSEILNNHSEILLGHTRLLEKQGEVLGNMDTSLTTLVDISSKQFGQQQKFNEQFLDRIKDVEKELVHVVDVNDRIKRLEAAVFK